MVSVPIQISRTFNLEDMIGLVCAREHPCYGKPGLIVGYYDDKPLASYQLMFRDGRVHAFRGPAMDSLEAPQEKPHDVEPFYARDEQEQWGFMAQIGRTYPGMIQLHKTLMKLDAYDGKFVKEIERIRTYDAQHKPGRQVHVDRPKRSIPMVSRLTA